MFRCATKQKEYLASWHQQNKEKRASEYQDRYKNDPGFRAKRAFYQREYNKRIKLEVITQYGGECRGCGEKHPDLLCIDHIYGGGVQHRKELKRKSGRSFYAWLKHEGFPSGFQLLCFNCNNAKGVIGHIPHKVEVHNFIRAGLGLSISL
jgi:5-methylcytosine-specific restriction endonuclease McrA